MSNQEQSSATTNSTWVIEGRSNRFDSPDENPSAIYTATTVKIAHTLRESFGMNYGQIVDFLRDLIPESQPSPSKLTVKSWLKGQSRMFDYPDPREKEEAYEFIVDRHLEKEEMLEDGPVEDTSNMTAEDFGFVVKEETQKPRELYAVDAADTRDERFYQGVMHDLCRMNLLEYNHKGLLVLTRDGVDFINYTINKDS